MNTDEATKEAHRLAESKGAGECPWGGIRYHWDRGQMPPPMMARRTAYSEPGAVIGSFPKDKWIANSWKWHRYENDSMICKQADREDSGN